MRASEPNWLMSTLAPGCPLMRSKSSAGPPGAHLAERAAPAAGLADAVGDLGDLQFGIDLGAHALKLARALQGANEIPQIVISHCRFPSLRH